MSTRSLPLRTIQSRHATVAVGALVVGLSAITAQAQSLPTDAPDIQFHLTARPWSPIDASKTELLDKVDAIVHALAPLQNSSGSIIDPYNNAEVQYATPYFTFAVATALSQGRASDLITKAVAAMDRCTTDISDGQANDGHGEFFCAPMVKALRLLTSLKAQYPTYITDSKIATWRSRMSKDRAAFMNMTILQNWRTYASKGEWLRQQEGLISNATSWIEGSWTQSSEGNQRERFRRGEDIYGQTPAFYFYHDDTGIPETFAYNGAATGNLLDMLEAGYNGASATEMRTLIETNLTSSLLLMGATGEAPAGGRSGDHVWNDVVYANDYEMMAEIAYRNGEPRRAGQFRRAAQLAFKSAWRFQQEKGWFSVTKSLLHPSLKNRYARYSALTNYNGYTEIHSSEAYFTRQSTIAEQPSPCEIGGYAITLDPTYAHSFLNAGGMQAQVCTKGTTDHMNSNVNWSTLGITRFSRTGWDSRLGPGNGAVSLDFSNGAAFSPVFFENGAWTRVCQQPARFGGTFTPTFAHPLLVRGTYVIAPNSGQTGPTFTMNITLTPDGALVDTLRTSGTQAFGVIWPLLEYDGRTVLNKSIGSLVASTAFPYLNGAYTALQAETAALSGGVLVATNWTGYNGTGFVDFPSTGGVAQWNNVNGGAGGATVIGFRYALGNTSRTVNLTVNGVTSAITFDGTGKFDDWHQFYAPATLTSGATNTIRLSSTGQDCANIDELRVYPAVSSPPEMDQQNFIALKSTHTLDATAAVMRGGYGDLRPIRVTDSGDAPVQTFVYPRSPGDPSAENVRASFTRNGDDFSSLVGRVKGSLYVGGTSAGGRGAGIDLDNNGTDDVTFSQSCNFILQLSSGAVIAVETDSTVTATIAGRTLNLLPYSPVTLNTPNYDLFKATSFTAAQQADATISGPTADANNDGVTNLQAYASGLDAWTPATAANGGRPDAQVQGGYLTVTFTRLKTATDVTCIPEVSADLSISSWNSGAGFTTQVGVISLDSRREQVTVRDNVPVSTTPRRFMRVRFVSSP
jgi:hypothetical protein